MTSKHNLETIFIKKRHLLVTHYEPANTTIKAWN